MKILTEFKNQVKHIKKSVILTDSMNYSMWREEIILAAKQSETDDILNEKQSALEDDAYGVPPLFFRPFPYSSAPSYISIRSLFAPS
ncbi:hypothetical protein PABG_00339 [Paracoccidioides brasiliensis Pb03]|nr:hypothetical protein PABG_00339 [Paracoccidioides brasiliensis Pb03]